MDSIVCTALEEICCQGNKGIPLVYLWSRLSPPPLSPSVKAHAWRNLLKIPQLQFKAKNTVYKPSDASIQQLEEALRLDLRIVANEKLRGNFVGLYDAQSTIPTIQRRNLERLAVARANGVAQNLLAKEFGIEGRKFFYIMKNLESRGLIVRQPAIVRTKEVDGEGDSKTTSCVSTNVIYLSRYAKPLGSQQRFEICKEDSFSETTMKEHEATDNLLSESIKEDTLIKDFLPAMRAICDKLEEANDKILVVSDIKQDLGYMGSHSRHRAWRSVCSRLTDSHVVEELDAEVNNKVERCLRLLKTFSAKYFNYSGKKQLLKFGRSIIQKTEQTLELPLDNQIYDIVDAEGSKGLAVMEVSERLGIDKKKSYSRLCSMCSRVGMHLQAESHKKTRVFRVWTSRHALSKPSDLFPDKAENLSKANNVPINGSGTPHDTSGLPQTSIEHTLSGSDADFTTPSRLTDSESNSGVLGCSQSNAKRRNVFTRRNLQESSHEIADKVVDAAMVPPDLALSEMNHLVLPKPDKPKAHQPHRITVGNSRREKRILERLNPKDRNYAVENSPSTSGKRKRATSIKTTKEGDRSIVIAGKKVLNSDGSDASNSKNFQNSLHEDQTPIRIHQENNQQDNAEIRDHSEDEGQCSSIINRHASSKAQKFLHSISKSPFPVNTGRRAAKFSRWLIEHERDLITGGVALTSDLQCGDVLIFFSLVASGELSISVSLPEEGVGEAGDRRGLKRRADDIEESEADSANKKLKLLGEGEITIRKEKGFPGIAVSVRRRKRFKVDDSSSVTFGTGIECETNESTSPVPLYPWVNADGSMNTLVLNGLVRRVLGTVMQNPGIPEDKLINLMDVLNPQSCRKLLELMTLNGYMKAREMVQTKFTGPPCLLAGPRKPELIRRKHLFANSKGLFAL